MLHTVQVWRGNDGSRAFLRLWENACSRAGRLARTHPYEQAVLQCLLGDTAPSTKLSLFQRRACQKFSITQLHQHDVRSIPTGVWHNGRCCWRCEYERAAWLTHVTGRWANTRPKLMREALENSTNMLKPIVDIFALYNQSTSASVPRRRRPHRNPMSHDTQASWAQ